MCSNNSDNRSVFLSSLHTLQNNSRFSMVCSPPLDNGIVWSSHASNTVMGLPQSQHLLADWNLTRRLVVDIRLVMPYLFFAAPLILWAREHQYQVLAGSSLVCFLYLLKYNRIQLTHSPLLFWVSGFLMLNSSRGLS